MTKYYCKQCDPEHKTVYDQSFVNHAYADGRPGSHCIFCNVEYTPTDEPRKESVSANVKLKGAGWASKDIKLQRNAVKAYQNFKYKKVDE